MARTSCDAFLFNVVLFLYVVKKDEMDGEKECRCDREGDGGSGGGRFVAVFRVRLAALFSVRLAAMLCVLYMPIKS